MKIKELRLLSDQELELRAQELRYEKFQFRLRKAGGQLEKTHLARQYRRETAQCLTLIRERQLNGARMKDAP